MQQLSGLDAEFLAMESTAVFGHVGSVSVLDPSTAPEPLTLQRLTEHLAGRIHQVPVFRRRLVQVPFGLAQPYWVDDPDFTLEYHVRELALPTPGDDAQLARQVARLHARPLDRSHPLWELYLISGLAGGRSAIYAKIHHAAMDGVGGDAMLAAVLDPTPHARPRSAPAAWRPDPLPSTFELLARGTGSLVCQPWNAVRLGADLVRHSPGLAAAALERLPLPQPLRPAHDVASAPAYPGLRAPHTPFNARITPHRRCAFVDLPLEPVRQIRHRSGATVNDVVMALCAGALRHWLAEHQALPDVPLVAAVPVSLRTERDADTFGNRVSAMLATLPTDEGDPGRRLAAATAAMYVAKHDHNMIPPSLLEGVSQLAAPLVAGLGWRVSARLSLMEHVNPWNLFVSNVPGPRVPLYYAGAQVVAYYPLSAIAHGQGLNITVFSYAGRLCFGLLADRTLVPDLDVMAARLPTELALLAEATGDASCS